MSKIARLLVVAAATVSLWVCASARGSTITLGSLLPASSTSASFFEPTTLAPLTFSEPGALAQSPVNGAIVKWRIRGASSIFGYAVRVLRRGTGLEFTGGGTSTPVTPAGPEVESFDTNLPIQAGDFIGLNLPKEGFIDTLIGGSAARFSPTLEEGATNTALVLGVEAEFNADVQPAPAIIMISPTSGPTTGGTAVKIAGSDFTGVTAVKFGARPASSFTVESEGRLTAVSPASSQGVVDISVTTNAGISPATGDDHFKYTAPSKCVVPNLKGKRLKAAKKRARKAHCKIGEVKKLKGATAKDGKVVKQRPRAGKSVPAGTKIAVTLR